MNVHQITLQGYTAGAAPSTDPASNCVSGLYLGTAGSYGVEQLDVIQSTGWENLSVTAIFQPCGVKITVPAEGGTIDVPWEATADMLSYPQGRIVFQGYADGELVNSCDLPYTVSGHSSTEGNNPQPPTPDQYQQFVNEVQASADAAANSATAAAGSATAAAGSAQQATETLQQVQEAGQQATQGVQTAQTQAVQAVGNAQAQAVQAIQDQQQTSVGAVQTAQSTAVDQVNQAGQQQSNAVTGAGAAQVQAVQQAGAQQIQDVNTAGDNKLNQINTAIAHPPQPNTATGFWQVWNAETGQYEDTTALYQGGYYTPSVADDGTLTWTGSQAGMPALPSVNIRGPQGMGVPTPSASNIGQVPTVNNTGDGYLLTGPYAPLEASIRPTASGNPAVCSDSIAWSLQGLKLYGKSIQDGTPSPENPVPIVSAGDAGSIALSITDGASQSQSLTLSTPSGLPGIPVDSGGNYTDLEGQRLACNVIDLGDRVQTQNCKTITLSSALTWYQDGDPQISDGDAYFYTPDISLGKKRDFSLCNYATYKLKDEFGTGDKWADGFYTNAGSLAFEVRFNGTLEEWKAYIDAANPPIEVLIVLDNPITTPLSAEEVAAYRALQTYSGTTVVSTAEPVAGIEAQYIMDGTVAWNKINAALAQISSSTTQTSQVVNTMLGAE